MNVLSVSYLALTALSSILVWMFSGKDRVLSVMVCNIAFLFLLRAEPMDIVYVLLLTVYTWLAGLYAEKEDHNAYLKLLLCFLPAAGLAFFKYAGYFSDRVVMPLGLSFYTFKAIAYIADCKRKQFIPQGLLYVFDYLCFFPSFMAGPIHRPNAFFQELSKPMQFDYKDQKNGFIQAVLGLFEKLVIASEFSHLVTMVGESELGGWYSVLYILLYSFEIYTDFDSYSNIAIGIARMMGFHLDKNFNVPYLSASLKEFWARWHISLSSWLRDYIYIPLGGSRKGKMRKYINTIIVFFVSGMWHGSTGMFLVWGLGHGICNVVEDVIRQPFHDKKLPKAIRPLFVLINFVIVSVLWVYFQADSVASANALLLSVFNPNGFDYALLGMTFNEFAWMWILMGIVVMTDILRYHWNMLEGLSHRIFIVRWAFYIALMAVAIIFGVYGPGYHPENFIYVTF